MFMIINLTLSTRCSPHRSWQWQLGRWVSSLSITTTIITIITIITITNITTTGGSAHSSLRGSCCKPGQGRGAACSHPSASKHNNQRKINDCNNHNRQNRNLWKHKREAWGNILLPKINLCCSRFNNWEPDREESELPGHFWCSPRSLPAPWRGIFLNGQFVFLIKKLYFQVTVFTCSAGAKAIK